MARFEFNPISNYLSLKFICPYCGEENETDAFDIPTPDFTAESHSDSINSEVYEYQCHKCDNIFEINIYNGMWGGEGEISDVESGVIVEEECIEEDFIEEDEKAYSVYFDSHLEETLYALNKIDTLDEKSKKLLYRTLYANVISSLEAYLSDRLIQKVLSSGELKKKFVESFKIFQETKFSISEIYEQMDALDNRIKNSLRDIIYHNLPIVKNIYRLTLDVDLGDISDLMKCISIRHDIVHRNGRDKDGNLSTINKDDVLELAEIVSNFISNIEKQIINE